MKSLTNSSVTREMHILLLLEEVTGARCDEPYSSISKGDASTLIKELTIYVPIA